MASVVPIAKRCSRCRRLRLIDRFRKSSLGNRASVCMPCVSAQVKKTLGEDAFGRNGGRIGAAPKGVLLARAIAEAREIEKKRFAGDCVCCCPLGRHSNDGKGPCACGKCPSYFEAGL